MKQILILDDERKDLDFLADKLEEQGYECVRTQLAEEAVRQACSSRIGLVLVDEILWKPGILPQEKQDLQGGDVIQEIRAARPDMRFIAISRKPQIELAKRLRSMGRRRNCESAHEHAWTVTSILSEEEAKLRRRPGVLDLVNKTELERAPEEALRWLTEVIEAVLAEAPSQGRPTIRLRLLVCLPLPYDAYRLVVDVAKCRDAGIKGLPDHIILRDAVDTNKFDTDGLRRMVEAGRTELPFIGLPSGHLQPCHFLRPDALHFRILVELAKRDYRGQTVLIDQLDYDALKQGGRPRHPDEHRLIAARTSDRPMRSEERKNAVMAATQGLHVVGASDRSLAKQIYELRWRLRKEGIAADGPDVLFTCQHGAYSPTFPIRLAAMPATPAKKRPRRRKAR